MQIALLVHRAIRLAIFFFFFGGGGIPPEYTIWISCSCNAIYMHLHTILWWYIMRFATLVSLGRTYPVDHQYFPHVGPESTCCSINKKFDPWNSRQNKLKSQLYRLKLFGLSLGFHELWYLKKRLKWNTRDRSGYGHSQWQRVVINNVPHWLCPFQELSPNE